MGFSISWIQYFLPQWFWFNERKGYLLSEMFVYVFVWNVWGVRMRERERGVYYVRRKGEGSWVRVNVNKKELNEKPPELDTTSSPPLSFFICIFYIVSNINIISFLFLSLLILWVLIVVHVLIKQLLFSLFHSFKFWKISVCKFLIKVFLKIIITFGSMKFHNRFLPFFNCITMSKNSGFVLRGCLIKHGWCLILDYY